MKTNLIDGDFVLSIDYSVAQVASNKIRDHKKGYKDRKFEKGNISFCYIPKGLAKSMKKYFNLSTRIKLSFNKIELEKMMKEVRKHPE